MTTQNSSTPANVSVSPAQEAWNFFSAVDRLTAETNRKIADLDARTEAEREQILREHERRLNDLVALERAGEVA